MVKRTILSLGLAFVLSAEISFAQSIVIQPGGSISLLSPHSGRVIYASAVGAKLDTNLTSGGGTDDTTVLQNALNAASDGTPTKLIMDGAALIGGLDIYGRTTIECINGGGFYLKNGANRSALENKNVKPAGQSPVDAWITITGCHINGNRTNQSSTDGAGYPVNTITMIGVNDLIVRNVLIIDSKHYGMLIANGSRAFISDSWVLNPSCSAFDTTDGVHFTGPWQYATLNNLILQGCDDLVAFNTNDGADFTGAITDVAVSNVVGSGHSGLSIRSKDQIVDRISVSNYSGTFNDRFAVISAAGETGTGNGDYRGITISNVTALMATPSNGDASVSVSVFSVNAVAQNISLKNITVNPFDTRPVVLVSSNSNIVNLNVDLDIYDPSAQSTPIKVDGGTVARLNANVNWKGRDGATNPLSVVNSGTVTQQNWVQLGTSP